MNILVTNDDGINSRGIFSLVESLRTIGTVVVVAPLGEQSAVGHAVTVSMPLRVTDFHKNGEFFGFAVSGTPADCVKLALRTLLRERGLPQPDIVISGINHGRNTAVNVIYSGTVSAATEATVLDVPAMAISLTSYHAEADFGAAARFASEFAPMVVHHGLPRGTLLNINVPPVPFDELEGVAYTKQGASFWEDDFEKRMDPQERPYYWLRGRYVTEPDDIDADDAAISRNQISVTPIHYDLTNYNFLERMRREWR
jgi:5'-nucleotidase